MSTSRPSPALTIVLWMPLAGMMTSVGLTGCTPANKVPFQAHRYRIDVTLDPATHSLAGRTILDLQRVGDGPLPPGEPVSIEIQLHRDLEVSHIEVSGATLKRWSALPYGKKARADLEPHKYLVRLAEPVEALTLFVHYAGTLYQDVEAGEKPGQIHNFTMSAHVGEEGVYLAGGPWYPEPVLDEDAAPRLADYVLTLKKVTDFEFVAGAERDREETEKTGLLTWRSPYPLDGMVLVGGQHEVHTATHNGIEISLHLKPEQAVFAEDLFTTLKGYFDRYEPLVGPYPASEYCVVDNFFSSGFAFPTFTLLSSAVINMGNRELKRHGVMDHELTHCWWGNGIFVDPGDGNWCEALASYATNYYGHVLDGREDEARRNRRNNTHFLSRMNPKNDKPLGTYGRENGCSRGIAYNKGSAVFHILARKIGQETFWSAMRRFTKEYVGSYASWEDIRRICEEESGANLQTFIDQWVRGSGAPTLEIQTARYNRDNHELTIQLSQGENSFDLDVPVRVTHDEGTLDLTIRMSESTVEATFDMEVVPWTVVVDPDYHIFRKVSLNEVVPTTAKTRYGKAFAVVVPDGALHEQYAGMKEDFESSFEEDERVSLTAGQIEEGALADRCVLILGEAVRDRYISGFLSAIEFPVHFTDQGFEFDGTAYTDPGDAILCTVRHPGVEGGGVTIIYGNSDEAVPRAFVIPFYSHSMVIFKNAVATFHHDFEGQEIITVEHVGAGSNRTKGAGYFN